VDRPGNRGVTRLTYLERDLRQLLNVTRLRDYERFLRAAALRTAQLLNRAELARDVGISGSTAGEWIAVLEASGQVALLEPWFSSRTKVLVKTPKLYLSDTGLCAFLMGITGAHDLPGSPLVGALWETLVFAEIRRRQVSRQGGWALNFWRDRTREADFLLHRGGRFGLADAKWTASPDARDAALLERVAAELPRGHVDRQTILCRCENPYPLTSAVEARPREGAAMFLAAA
jgi:predicted AAA+ superfamily ATPase